MRTCGCGKRGAHRSDCPLRPPGRRACGCPASSGRHRRTCAEHRTSARVARILELVSVGVKQVEVARICCVTPQAVSHLVKRAKEAENGRGYGDAVYPRWARHLIRRHDHWLIDGGPELVRIGVLDPDGTLTLLGLDVVHAMRAR